MARRTRAPIDAAAPEDPELREQVRRSALDYTLRQLAPTAPAMAFAHVLFFALARRWADGPKMQLWLVASLVICVVEFASVSVLLHRPPPLRAAVVWLGVIQAVHGTCWGAAALLFQEAGDRDPWLLLLVFLLRRPHRRRS